MLALALAIALVAGCSRTERAAPAPPVADFAIASFNFPESEVLAEIYAQGLEQAGVSVRRDIDLGPRELVLPALEQGLVDMVPEYLGSALDATAPPGGSVRADRADPAGARVELAKVLAPYGLEVLSPAPAANQNALAVTAATAERLGLRATSDLGPVAAMLTIGGPPECPSRPRCLVGLDDVYGLRFGPFIPLAQGRLVIRALEEGVIDVGVVFTTDAALVSGDLVVLADDRHLQPADNVVPVVRQAVVAGEARPIVALLDAVSARLTTTDLQFLNWRVTVAGADPAREARGWLIRRSLIPR